MGLLSLLLCFTMMTQPANIIEELRTPEKVVTIVQTSEEVEHVAEEEPPVPAMHLWGVATVTYYDWGPCCCGQWAYGPTASGVNPTVSHTVACGDLPFGTRIMINGVEYTVEDRGVSGMWVDIFVGSHEEALQRGMHQAEVYIIDG